MSQFAPPPPSFPPGMPMGSYGGMPQPRKTSGMAVASLICGIIGCVPFLTSLLAVAFGVGGIKATSNPNVGGRGLAIAGLILGLVGLLGWGGTSGLLWVGYQQTKPARAAARQFLQDLDSGNVDAAQLRSASSMQRSVLEAGSTTLQGYGTLQDVTFMGFNTTSTMNAPTQATLTGTASFANGAKAVTIQLIKENGVYKVVSFQVQ